MSIASEIKTVHVEVVSDVICPWCYVGKRRLEKALRSLPDMQVKVQWRPFELNPDTPAEGFDRPSYLAKKYGLVRIQQMHEQLAEVARADGIEFHFERQARIPNTRQAHRLIWLASRSGHQDAVVEALFRAYFIEGKEIGQRSVLSEVATGAGMDPGPVADLFQGHEGLVDIQADEERAYRLGISGVPSFVVNGHVMASGAQPPEALIQGIRHHARMPVVSNGFCSLDSPC